MELLAGGIERSDVYWRVEIKFWVEVESHGADYQTHYCQFWFTAEVYDVTLNSKPFDIILTSVSTSTTTTTSSAPE